MHRFAQGFGTLSGMTTNAVVPFRFVPEWTFGERVRKIRRESGLSQTEFATRIGANDRALASWETGRTKPQDIVAVAKRIRKEFGVPTAWTLGTEEEGPGGGGEPPRVPPGPEPTQGYLDLQRLLLAA
jgi:transcriptional regulator with XRE-family HTH domain